MTRLEDSSLHGATNRPKTALVLSGGGARGAYQVGVLRGILEVASSLGIRNPFQILTGVSAGAVNTAYLAAHATDLTKATQRLISFWHSLHSEKVYRTDPWSIGQIGVHWALDAISGGTRLGQHTHALLDTSPLGDLLRSRIPFKAIQKNLDAGHIDAVAVSATDYFSSECMTFCMARREITPWRRSRRVGVARNIGVEHVMASSAIPLLFPSVSVDDRPFGDGCVRNNAPLSPAVHLGAQKLIIVGVRKAPDLEEKERQSEYAVPPSHASIARVLNVVINAVLLDGVDADIERLARINRTVALLSHRARTETTLRQVDWLYCHPSVDIATIAMEETASVPRLMRYLFAGMGSLADAADVLSYLMFEPAFVRRVIDLGYRDARARKDEIEAFLSPRLQSQRTHSGNAPSPELPR